MIDNVVTDAPAVSVRPISEQLTFNFKAITARQIIQLNKAVAAGDIETIAGFFAKMVSACPPEWGAPDSIDTYLDLPYFLDFADIVTAMVEAGKNAKRP